MPPWVSYPLHNSGLVRHNLTLSCKRINYLGKTKQARRVKLLHHSAEDTFCKILLRLGSNCDLFINLYIFLRVGGGGGSVPGVPGNH